MKAGVFEFNADVDLPYLNCYREPQSGADNNRDAATTCIASEVHKQY